MFLLKKRGQESDQFKKRSVLIIITSLIVFLCWSCLFCFETNLGVLQIFRLHYVFQVNRRRLEQFEMCAPSNEWNGN